MVDLEQAAVGVEPMTEETDSDFGPITSLGTQADEIIDENTEWVDLVEKLDVHRFERRDEYPDWHDSIPFRRMFLAYVWAKAEDISLTTIPSQLEANPELATAIGFDLDDLPSESTCKPTRLEEGRFEELQTTAERGVTEIRRIAAERGSPIGNDLLSYYNDDSSDEHSEPTKRTKNRLLRGKMNEVFEEINTVILPSMWLPRPEEPVYDEDELLTHEAVAAIGQMAANGAGEVMGDKKNPEGNPDDPFDADGPTGETLLEAIKEMSVDETTTMINFALRKSYTRAKPKLRELHNASDERGRFGIHSMVAIDITYVVYRGEREGLEWLQGAPDHKDYQWCHKFATATVVGENIHFVLAVCPLGSTDYAANQAYPGDNDQSYFIGDVARRLLSQADQYVSIKRVFADREFAAADVITALEERNLQYVMPISRNDRIKRKCNQFDQLKRGYAEIEDDRELYVEKDYPLRGQVKNSVSNTRVTTNLVILPPDEDDPTRGHSPQPFITNEEASDEIALDRRRTTERIERYNNRATIENSYASIKQCAAWTTSKEFEVRWFHFAFGCVVYNLWLLTDFLVKDRIGVIETTLEPEITLKRFLSRADDLLVKLI